jgi:hypothetical protein
MRNPNDPFYNTQHNGYYNGNGGAYDNPAPAQYPHPSYETMTSGSDENGKSTNPSSLNSSFDHLHLQQRKPEPQSHENQYSNEINFAPVSSQQLYSNYAAANHNAHEMNGDTQVRDYDPYSTQGGPSNGSYGPPRPPVKDFRPLQGNNPRQPIKLTANQPVSPPVQEKRQSWLKRTFSRRA